MYFIVSATAKASVLFWEALKIEQKNRHVLLEANRATLRVSCACRESMLNDFQVTVSGAPGELIYKVTGFVALS